MNDILSLAGIAAALALGTVSPGPSFVMIARMAVASGRGEALAAAVGMGLGGISFTIAALLGLQALLLAVPSLYLALKIAGGLYLVHIGVCIWRGARQPLTMATAPAGERRHSLMRALFQGLGTQLANPKAAIIYASIFAAFLPNGTTLPLGLAIVALVFVLETGWYALVALALSAEKPRHAYLRGKPWIDRAAGGVMMALGVKLASSAHAA